MVGFILKTCYYYIMRAYCNRCNYVVQVFILAVLKGWFEPPVGPTIRMSVLSFSVTFNMNILMSTSQLFANNYYYHH